MSSRVAARPAVQTPRRQTTTTTIASPSRTASPSKTTTPAKQTVTDSPGNWRHPRLDEITRRRAATAFSETNIKTVVYNGLALGVVYVARTASGTTYQQLSKTIHNVISAQHIGLFWFFIQLVLFFNIVKALLPLFRQQDDLADIPLTPSQRKLLGLTPLKTPATPNAVYSTPPRYSRTPSRSGSPAPASPLTANASSSNALFNGNASNNANSRSYTGSPIAGSPLFTKTRAVGTRASGFGGGGGSSSPFTPGSPYQSPFQSPFGKAGGGSSSRRSSFGSPADLGAPILGAAPPSPGSGKRLSVGLNNKWLYEKGRRSSGGAARIY